MTDYILRDGDPTAPPNYEFPGVVVRSFLLEARLPALKAVCDNLLNIAPASTTGFEFVPLLPCVFLGVLSYPKMLDVNPDFEVRGYAQQHELYFAFIVAKMIDFDPQAPDPFEILVPGGLSMFFPYIFVDNPWSMLTGREVIGFPKLLARYEPEPPLEMTGNFSLTAKTLLLDPLSPDTLLAPRAFVEIGPAGAQAAARHHHRTRRPVHARQQQRENQIFWPWAHFGEGVDELLHPELNTALQDLSAFDLTETVQLKQIRDSETATEAAYQALVQGDFQMQNLEPGDPLPAMQVTIPTYASLKIAQTLGIPVDGTGKIVSLNQVQMKLDMSYGNVSNLYVAT